MTTAEAELRAFRVPKRVTAICWCLVPAILLLAFHCSSAASGQARRIENETRLAPREYRKGILMDWKFVQPTDVPNSRLGGHEYPPPPDLVRGDIFRIRFRSNRDDRQFLVYYRDHVIEFNGSQVQPAGTDIERWSRHDSLALGPKCLLSFARFLSTSSLLKWEAEEIVDSLVSGVKALTRLAPSGYQFVAVDEVVFFEPSMTRFFKSVK